ncbi:MAG: TrmH family RNA methyltransferase, partial [Planctomycetia bacterium]
MKRPRQPSRRPAPPERPAERSARRPPASVAGRKPAAAAAGERPAARHRGKAEEKYHGVRACEALFARRPQDIIRVYVDQGRRRQFAALLDHCAKARLGFQVVAAENLARLSGSMHHEGVVILARELPRWSSAELLQAVEGNRLKGPLLYLDGVQNPHNLGAILRTAAHFGVAAVLGRTDELPPLSPAAVRVAEGAAEYVPVCGLAEPKADLARLKERGFRVVTTSSHRGRDISPEALGGRIVLVLGGEGEGVSKPIAALADEAVRIPGTGVVESL